MVLRHLLPLLLAANLAPCQTILDVQSGEANLRTAMAEVRKLLPGMSQDIHVRLHGRFALTAPLIFDENDAGRNGYKVYWESPPGETATISGGESIAKFQQEDRFWIAKVGASSVRQFYVNDTRKIRARTPNVENPVDNGPYLRVSSWDLENSSAVVPASDVPEGAADSGVEWIAHKHWNICVMRVARIVDSSSSKRIVFRHPDVDLNRFEYPAKEAGQPYRWENSKRFLDAPGEWYFDKLTGIVYYYPVPGESISSANGFVPRLENLVRFEGTHDIVLNRLIIQHSGWNRIDSTGYGDDQGSISIPGASMSNPVSDSLASYLLLEGAVTIDSSHHIWIRRCDIQHTGGQGILFQGNTYGNRVFGNILRDIGANGIAFRQRYLQSSGGSNADTIDDNSISDVGRFFSGATAINAMYPASIVIEYNRIFSTPYSGISIGWDWDGFKTSASRNSIRFNEIASTNQLHDDGGGIYTLGLQPGSRVSNNWIHDIHRSPWMGASQVTALYFDAASKGFDVSDNSLFGIDSQSLGRSPIFVQIGVSGSDVVLGENPTSRILETTRRNSGPRPELFWNSASMIAIPDSLNLALGTVATSSTPSSPSDGNGNDGDTNTHTQLPVGTGDWWQIDLGGPTRIDQIELVGVSQNTLQYDSARCISIEASNDPGFGSITELGRWSDAKQGIISNLWVGAKTATPIRYVRLRNRSSESIQFSELRIRGHRTNETKISKRDIRPESKRPSIRFEPLTGELTIDRHGHVFPRARPNGKLK
ncbi:MAG: Endo,4-beta-xylanase [Fibrobacterota bacterium]|jgi:hypothetical protein